MQLYYLLVVVVVSEVKVMSCHVTVAAIFAVINYSAITRVANNYSSQTEPRFLTEPNQTHSELNPIFFQSNRNRTEIKKSIPHVATFLL